MSAEQLSLGNLFGVNGLTVVVTGGGSGLGAMIARALDANGADTVYIVGRRKEALDEVAKSAINGKIVPIQGDITSKDSLKAVAEQVRKEKGYINVLFANSGIIDPAQHNYLPQDHAPSLKEFADGMFSMPMEDVTNNMHVNVTGTMFTTFAFLDLLDAGNKKANVTQKSQVIIMASIAGLARIPAAGFPYSASKSALIHLMKQMASRFAEWKIRVNAIAPGMYYTDMTSSMKWFTGDPRIEGNVDASNIPFERFGGEEDMAGLALFLCGKAGAFMTGTTQVTDGGRLCIVPGAY